MNKKIIIIGGSGFIGTHLINKLNIKSNVLNLDKRVSKLNIFQKIGDIRDINFLKKNLEKDSIIIHLAAEHKDNVEPKELYYEVNCDGTKNIVDVVKEKNIKKIIFLSTVAVYGNESKKISINEKSNKNPSNHYGKSKLIAEKILLNWAREKVENELVIIRPTAVFGEGCTGNIFNLAKHIYYKKPLIKSLDIKKSIVSVNEVVACIYQNICQSNKLLIANVIGKKDLKVKNICNIFSIFFHGKNYSFYLPYNITFRILNLINFFTTKIFDKEFIYKKRAEKFLMQTIFESDVYKNIYDNEDELKKYAKYLSKNINFNKT